MVSERGAEAAATATAGYGGATWLRASWIRGASGRRGAAALAARGVRSPGLRLRESAAAVWYVLLLCGTCCCVRADFRVGEQKTVEKKRLSMTGAAAAASCFC